MKKSTFSSFTHIAILLVYLSLMVSCDKNEKHISDRLIVLGKIKLPSKSTEKYKFTYTPPSNGSFRLYIKYNNQDVQVPKNVEDLCIKKSLLITQPYTFNEVMKTESFDKYGKLTKTGEYYLNGTRQRAIEQCKKIYLYGETNLTVKSISGRKYSREYKGIIYGDIEKSNIDSSALVQLNGSFDSIFKNIELEIILTTQATNDNTITTNLYELILIFSGEN